MKKMTKRGESCFQQTGKGEGCLGKFASFTLCLHPFIHLSLAMTKTKNVEKSYRQAEDDENGAAEGQSQSHPSSEHVR